MNDTAQQQGVQGFESLGSDLPEAPTLSSPLPVSEFLSEAPTLSSESEASLKVFQGLQSALIKAGHDLEVTGEFDPATVRELQEFQAAHDLSLTGELDSKTWTELVKYIEIEVPPPTEEELQAVTERLQNGTVDDATPEEINTIKKVMNNFLPEDQQLDLNGVFDLPARRALAGLIPAQSGLPNELSPSVWDMILNLSLVTDGAPGAGQASSAGAGVPVANGGSGGFPLDSSGAPVASLGGVSTYEQGTYDSSYQAEPPPVALPGGAEPNLRAASNGVTESMTELDVSDQGVQEELRQAYSDELQNLTVSKSGSQAVQIGETAMVVDPAGSSSHAYIVERTAEGFNFTHVLAASTSGRGLGFVPESNRTPWGSFEMRSSQAVFGGYGAHLGATAKTRRGVQTFRAEMNGLDSRNSNSAARGVLVHGSGSNRWNHKNGTWRDASAGCVTFSNPDMVNLHQRVLRQQFASHGRMRMEVRGTA